MSRIGIVTVTYNSAPVLDEFLLSVWNQNYHNFLLYIIDCGSNDETQARISAVEDTRLRPFFMKENIGFAAGSNVGIRQAIDENCQAVMLLNNDTVFGPDLFQCLLDGLNTYGCDMATPKMLYHGKPDTIWSAGGHLDPWIGYRQHHDGLNHLDDGSFDTPRPVTFTPFCCILMRTSVFQAIGYLDENYFVYVEDVDYCYRAYRAKLKLWYLPECRLFHKVSSLTGGTASAFSVQYGTRNRVYYMFKNLPRLTAIVWTAVYGMFHLLRRLAGRESPLMWSMRRSAILDGITMARRNYRQLRSEPHE